MKTLLILAGFVMMLNSSCKQTNVVADPVIDPRDQRIGVYVCEVKLKNYTTQQVFSFYIDTLEITKQGDVQLLVKSKKGVQLPVLKSMDSIGHGYVGLATVLTFHEGQSIQTNGGELIMSSGPDSKFYEYKGNKIR
ncbi:hypothetical protein HNV11_09895 [Spirosoma taeanense]|uniref:Uncharacterized protein n=1 Tax=Spirosoma taeanense TaxID=2735870 RepID=A0A6M5Y8W3_9BACT|nr:hypothetical protein [Spirosoma taeanense]QJW89671.1 hypothetical protein HNV11_09895 [Spirosoma taeanense]